MGTEDVPSIYFALLRIVFIVRTNLQGPQEIS